MARHRPALDLAADRLVAAIVARAGAGGSVHVGTAIASAAALARRAGAARGLLAPLLAAHVRQAGGADEDVEAVLAPGGADLALLPRPHWPLEPPDAAAAELAATLDDLPYLQRAEAASLATARLVVLSAPVLAPALGMALALAVAGDGTEVALDGVNPR